MLLVVGMQGFVGSGLVLVQVSVPLGEVQPDASGHDEAHAESDAGIEVFFEDKPGFRCIDRKRPGR